jgi:hypothetical protein
MLLGAAPTVRGVTTLNSTITGCTTLTGIVCDVHLTLPDVALAVTVTACVVGTTPLTLNDADV